MEKLYYDIELPCVTLFAKMQYYGIYLDKEELLKKTYLYAKENCRPKLQLKSTVISQEQVEIGETCTIIRNDLDIRYKTR